MFREAKVPGYNPGAFETKQVFYTSKDGTRIPMFLVYRKGLKLDGKNPTLLYGTAASTSSSRRRSRRALALLEQGFVYASANLRGGVSTARRGTSRNEAEEAERLRRFHRSSEWLIANKVHSPARLAVPVARTRVALVPSSITA